MESDGLGLDLALFDVDLVADEDNRDVLAHADQVTVPVGDILVCDTRGHIKHDNTALTVDVVAISQATEFFLSRRVPHIKLDLSVVLESEMLAIRRVLGKLRAGDDTYCGEAKRVNFHT